MVWLSAIALSILQALHAPLACAIASEPPIPPATGPAIRLVDPIEYRVQLDVSIESLGIHPVYLPYISRGACHVVDEQRLDEFVSDVPFNRHRVNWKYEIVEFGNLGAFAKVWRDAGGGSLERGFRIQQYVTVWSAEADDGALAAVEWPQRWPIEVDPFLRPQMYIESNNQRLIDQVNAWTGGEPKSVTPYFLGKELARQVVRFYQPSGSETRSKEKEFITAINVRGALAAIAEPRGPMNDAVCLYVGVCRAAGLPARAVIGIDYDSREPELISWAEYYVPTQGWISIDLRRLYASPGSMEDINRRWPGFASDDRLNERVPLSYYFYAPPIHRSQQAVERPLLWAWLERPEQFKGEQRLKIEVDHAPKRGGGP